MKRMSKPASCVVVAALALSGAAAAQSGPNPKLHCQFVSASSPEALGDREGHAIAVNTYSCRVEGGPGDGGVLTGTTIAEWDKGSAVVLSSSGVMRKPGAVMAFQHTEGKMSLVLTDGKVSGMTGTGRGRYTLASGSAAAMAGAPYSFSLRTTGPGLFVVDVRHDD